MKKYISIEDFYKKQLISKELLKRQKIFKYLLEVLCFSIILLSLGVIIKWVYDNYNIKKISKEIYNSTNEISMNKEVTLVNPPSNKNSDYYYYVSLPFYEVNFTNLLSKNNDTIGFINVKNTLINYPVVQGRDNNYYLKHSYDKKLNSGGWVFMDYRNNISELSDNTIIYGHARINGTIFGSLKNVLTSSWQNNRDNYALYFSTINENMLFQIFSIYTIKAESYYIMSNFNNNIEKEKWILTMQNRNIAPINVEVNINDKILTLSTCQNHIGDRIVVHAKLIKRQIIN